MAGTTRISIPTKTLFQVDTTQPRVTVERALNVLRGASAGAGNGKGVAVSCDATVASDTGVSNPGGTSLAGGVIWVSSVASTNAPDLQLGAVANVASLTAPNAFADPLAYVEEIIEVVGPGDLALARPNLDVDFGTTDLVYTQVAGAVSLEGGTVLDLSDGDFIEVCGVKFTAQTGGTPDVDTFDPNAVVGDSERFENKVGNHPALCGKIIANQSSLGVGDQCIVFGSVTPIPQLPFSFALGGVGNATTITVANSTNGWVDGAVGDVDPTFGTPLVLFYESNARQYEAGWGFSFDDADNGGIAPVSDPLSPTVSGFNGTATDLPPVVNSELRATVGASPARELQVTLTQKAVTSHYIKDSATVQFMSGSARTTAQEMVRLLDACLSGTGVATSISTIEVRTLLAGVQQATVTWTVGTR